MTRTTRHLSHSFLFCMLLVGCGSSSGKTREYGYASDADGGTSGGSMQDETGSQPGDGQGDGHSDEGSGASGDAGSADDADGGSSPSDPATGMLPKAGNPDGKCSEPLPAEAQPVDTSQPTTVVGTGSAESCTFTALASAIAQCGIITFDCGDAPATIAITSTLELRTDCSTVIDGGNKVTLDGGGNVRILHWDAGDWQKNANSLTLQHLVLAQGRAHGTDRIPTRDEPCSQGFNDGEGGALYMRDGSLRAIDVTFVGNRAAELGPDTGGGALYLLGSKPAYIVSCTFKDNQASNAGAMGSLFTTNFIYDSLYEHNAAVGHGANNDDPSMCDYINNGQHEIGSGGNGGAIYNDGVGVDVTICGTQVRHNTSGAFGAAVFFTSNDASNKGTLRIRDSVMFDNVPANPVWQWQPGISTNANTEEPTDSDIRP